MQDIHPSPTDALIRLNSVSKLYPVAGGSFVALDDVSLEIGRGEFVAVAGPSGSGKSTLLNLLAGIDKPSSGEVWVGGEALHTLSEDALSAWRGRNVGIVFQFFQLLPTLTVIENVMMPMDFGRVWPARERAGRALHLLEQLGVADQADKFPAALSGGQQQRVAVARALANAPGLVLADEPTGNLDSRNAQSLLEALATLVKREGITVVMVTHERAALRCVEKIVTLIDGRIAESVAEHAHV